MANEKEILSVVKSNVANALASAAADHVIAVATDIYDENLQYRQSVINQMLNDNKADLDESGKVPASQLPSYVDDVLEGYYNNSIFYKTKSGSTYSDPYTGENGKIYIDVDTNKSYRWSGTAYAEISSSLALGETSSTAYRGDRGKTAYDHSQSTHAPVNAQANTIETVKVNGTALTPDANKAVDITVPSVAGKEDTSNKVTSWSATPTNTHYPSEKLVKDSLDAKQATLTQGTDITISGTTISAKNTVKQLGYLSDLNVDVSTINGDFAIFFTDDAADNKPDEWTEGGLYATGMVYKPVNSNNSEWIQVCWRTTSNGSNMYSRYKNNGQSWSQWYCVDDNNKVGVIGNITDANIDCSNLKYNLYTFVTGNSCANTPWTGVESAIQATGLLFKKGNGVWQQLMWRTGVKGILYTRYYNSSGWSSSWYRLDSGYTNLGEVGTLDYNMRNVETDFAALTINMFTDGDENGISKSSPWGDQADVAVGRVICQYQKIGRDWYQTVWRQFPHNAGIYTRRCNIDDPNFEHKDSWRRIDNASQGGVTSVNTKTGAVVLGANDVNAVSTVASQGLTDAQKSNARTNIGAGTSNLTIGTTSTTAAAGNHTHSNYAVSRTLSDGDLNGVTTPGYYNAGGGNTIANKPSGVDNFGLEVIHTASGTYYTQLLYTHTGKTYKRESNGSTGTAVWGSWSEVTDTKNTAGATDTNSKIYLVGATSQGANTQTYTQDTAYVGTDGCLYSNSTKVLTDEHTTISVGTSNYYGKALSVAINVGTEAYSGGFTLYATSDKTASQDAGNTVNPGANGIVYIKYWGVTSTDINCIPEWIVRNGCRNGDCAVKPSMSMGVLTIDVYFRCKKNDTPTIWNVKLESNNSSYTFTPTWFSGNATMLSKNSFNTANIGITSGKVLLSKWVSEDCSTELDGHCLNTWDDSSLYTLGFSASSTYQNINNLYLFPEHTGKYTLYNYESSAITTANGFPSVSNVKSCRVTVSKISPYSSTYAKTDSTKYYVQQELICVIQKSGGGYEPKIYNRVGFVDGANPSTHAGTVDWGSWSEGIDPSNYVTITGEQTITGQKTFSAKDIHTGGVMVASDSTTGCNLLYNNSYNALMFTFN